MRPEILKAKDNSNLTCIDVQDYRGFLEQLWHRPSLGVGTQMLHLGRPASTSFSLLDSPHQTLSALSGSLTPRLVSLQVP